MDIVATVAIVGLVAVLIAKEVVAYKERVALAKINKAKDVSEVEYIFSPQKESEQEQSDLVSLEEMPDLE